MSGNIIGGIIGATIGFFVGGGIMGAIQGFAIGSAIGGALLPPDMGTQYGPRLEDLKAQSSEYGNPIPIVYGTAALQGTVIWAKDIKEVQQTHEGGKNEPDVVTYSYFGSFAVAVADGPINGFLRIWAGPEKRLIYDGSTLEGGQIRFYLGTETQMPDPLIEADKGVGFAPAYRGTAYIVLEDFPLEKDGNRLPFLTIEVSTATADTCPAPVSSVTVDGQNYAVYDPAPVKIADAPEGNQVSRFFSDATTGFIYYAYNNSGTWFFTRINPNTGEAGPPIGLGEAEPKIAWNNQGQAAIAEWAGIYVTRVDLESWQYVKEKALQGRICAGTTCADIDIELADVVWSDQDQEFKFLAYSNSTNGTGVGVPAIESTETVVSRAMGRPMPVNWGSTGARFSGLLLAMPGRNAAAGFQSQYSNYATDPGVFWGAYDSKRNVLVDFSKGVYADLDGAGYVNTSEFGIYGTGQNGIVYSPYVDMYFVVDTLGIRIYDPEKLTPVSWVPEDCVLFNAATKQVNADGEPIKPANYLMSIFLLPAQPDWLGVFTGSEFLKIYIGKQGRLKSGGAILADVIADLSKRAGLEATRYDVSQLSSDIVDGYIIARQTEVRAAILPLRSAFYFDAVESQGVIRFVKRGGNSITVISDADLAARDQGSEPPDPLQTKRGMENELPRALTVKYMLAASDYSAAAKQARRLIGASGDEQTLEMPLVLTDAKAKEIAEVNLHSAWVERLSYSFSLPRKYSYLEPTDLVLVKGHLMRLTSVKASPRGVLQCEALADGSYYAPDIVVSETQPNIGQVSRPGPSRLELF